MVTITFTGTVDEVRDDMHKFVSGVQTTPAPLSQSLEKKLSPKKEAEPTAPVVAATPGVSRLDEAKALIPGLIKKITKEGMVKLFAERFAPHSKASDLSAAQLEVFITTATELTK